MAKRMEDVPSASTGERISFFRDFSHVTQKELASRAEINDALWRQYEAGTKIPKAAQLEKIAKSLNVPVNLLLPLDVTSPGGLIALIFELILQFGDLSMEKDDDTIAIRLPANIKHRRQAGILLYILDLLDEVKEEDVLQQIAEMREFDRLVREGNKELFYTTPMPSYEMELELTRQNMKLNKLMEAAHGIAEFLEEEKNQ